MIEIKNVTKAFGDKKALDGISFNIETGSIFGLVGSNGAGKSTLLRILSGVFDVEGGEALIDGEKPFENTAVKQNLAFVSDFPYFVSGATLKKLANEYSKMYPSWNKDTYDELLKAFPIDPNQRTSTMSKGMQRQVAIILALSHNPKYVFMDEVFDGLDPVVRELVKRVIIKFVEQNNTTVVIASHNLRELEGFCDHIGLVHNGEIVMEHDIDSDSIGLYRFQFVMSDDDYNEIKGQLAITKEKRQGAVIEITVSGDRGEIEEIVNSKNPSFCEILPLTLEELFISKMEVSGYDLNKIEL